MLVLERDDVVVNHISADLQIAELSHPTWRTAKPVALNRYWSGTDAPATRHAVARLLWSDTSLYVRFDSAQEGPLVVSDTPDLQSKTLGLWDRDVCEIFVAPDKSEPRRYFEFEASPVGEWVDLTIDLTSGMRRIDVDYESGMSVAASSSEDKTITVMQVPFKAFGKRPSAGDVWLGNLFRCVGKDPDRGYLAYNPTETTVANFHVPEKFVGFEFRK
jgi:hypothetical protein